MASRLARWGTIGTVLACVVGSAGGCTDAAPEGQRSIRAEAIDRSKQELAIGAVSAVNGLYGAGCIGRSGPWSVRLSGIGALANPALSVVSGNAACVLTLTELVANATYALSPSIALGSAYQGAASSLASGSAKFYANAKLSSAALADDFVITILYADDPAAVTSGAVSASYATVAGTGALATVTAPDYGVTTSGLDVRVDGSNIVKTVSGSVTLNDGATTGSSYVVQTASLGASPTLADVDTAYGGGSAVAIVAANPQIAGSAFGLVGVDLTASATRTIIVRRVVSGIPAYELVTLTFSHP